MPEQRIGVVGGTGAVGTVTLELLAQRGYDNVRVFASARSAGQAARPRTTSRKRRPTRWPRATSTCSSSRSARRRRASSCRTRCAAAQSAIDKSSAYRLEPRHPTRRARGERRRARSSTTGIIANPNCCTIPLTTVLKPLHEEAGLVRVRVATYQSVSGAGAQAMERLRERAAGEHDLRMDWDFDGEEFDEESKLRDETRKIMELPELPIQATCVRVPVMVGHAEAIWVEFEDELTPERARELLAAAPSVRVEDVPVARQGSGRRRRARRPHSPRPDGRARPCALPGERQPPQGRGAQRDPDRGARAPARTRRSLERAPCGSEWSGGSSPLNWRPPVDEIRFAAEHGFAAIQIRSDRAGGIAEYLRADPPRSAQRSSRRASSRCSRCSCGTRERRERSSERSTRTSPRSRRWACSEFTCIRSAAPEAEPLLGDELGAALAVARREGLTFGVEHNARCAASAHRADAVRALLEGAAGAPPRAGRE